MRFSRERSAHLKFTLFAIAAVLMLAGIPVAFSQVSVAAIRGTVTDPSGAVAPNAKAAAPNTATGIRAETVSNHAGYFIFPSLQVGGPYTVTASAAGSVNFVASRLTLNTNHNREVLAALKRACPPQFIPDFAIRRMKYTKSHNARVLAGKPFL